MEQRTLNHQPNMIEITDILIKESKGKFGFTRPQSDMANKLFGSSWQKKLRGRLVDDEWWGRFCRLNNHGSPISEFDKSKKAERKLNNREAKLKRRAARRKRKLALLKSPEDFYSSPQWIRLRYRVLKNNDGCCELCGRSKRNHGVVLHVDHIKPKSKHPELALDYNNLQILCEDCNIGKSNKDCRDWRKEREDEKKDS